MDGTPYYLVDLNTFRNNCIDIMHAFIEEWGENLLFGYSVKTNHYKGLIEYAYNELGWYIETVSSDEYKYCRGLQINPSRMILNGPCKGTIMYSALLEGSYINLDNLDEVRDLCEHINLTNNIRVGLRVNFDLEHVCPGETTAGNRVSRFGIDCCSGDFENAINLLSQHGLKRIGLHMHTSTKTRSIAVFRALSSQAVNLINKYNIDLSFIDIGGGFFGGRVVDGKPSMKAYAENICSILKTGIIPSKTTLILEPGAAVLATCVSYVTKVTNIRKIRNISVVTLDGTLLHINPFMVERQQPFTMNIENDRALVDMQILGGCTCMENDRFGELKHMAELKVGDELKFKNAGAYTMALNSQFIIEPPSIRLLTNV